jgi:hypothetical protein
MALWRLPETRIIAENSVWSIFLPREQLAVAGGAAACRVDYLQACLDPYKNQLAA